MASYQDVTNKELWALHRQHQKAKQRAVTCEAGHPLCGCSTEQTQDGKAPCFAEVEKEILWRGAAAMDE